MITKDVSLSITVPPETGDLLRKLAVRFDQPQKRLLGKLVTWFSQADSVTQYEILAPHLVADLRRTLGAEHAAADEQTAADAALGKPRRGRRRPGTRGASA